MAPTILVVEDEPKLRELLRLQFERAGYGVFTSASGAEGLALASGVTPDLVVLDLRLPDIPGEDVAREIRESSSAAIVMLTAKAGEEDRIRGFEIGADDYVSKPFSPRELVLRVQAVLRRGQLAAGSDGLASFGGGEIGIGDDRRELTVRGELVDLTPTEWGILNALVKMPGRVYSRAELINRVRGYEYDGYERTVDSHIKNLRHKIELDPHRPRVILTVLGGGYRFGLERDV